jgi:AraC-like DNA-binding protein
MLSFEINFRSLLLLIAMVQGLVIAFLLLWRGNRQGRVQDFLLAGLLFFLACSLVTHFIGFMGVYDYMREAGHDLSFFPFSNNFTWGPLIWLYVQSVTDRHFRWSPRFYKHFLPALLYYVIHFGVWFLPQATKDVLFKQMPFWHMVTVLEASFYGFAFWYLRRSWLRYHDYRRLLDTEYSNMGQVTLAWLRNFIYGFCAYFGIDLCFGITGIFVSVGYTEAYWLELIRAIHLYYISVTGWAFAQKSLVPFQYLETRAAEVATQQHLPTEKMPPKPLIAPDELANRRQRLEQYMQSEKPWLDADLTLSQLSSQLSLNTTQLSYLVNQGFEKNFNDFVNHYRVEAVKQKMNDPSAAHLSLLGIAFECGFNSKATFNRAFKKLTGSAPTAFSA